MTQADATRIAALCDQQIERILSHQTYISPEEAEILFGLADLRNMYAGAPDISEMTPQGAPHSDVETYGDGTPGSITGGNAALPGTVLPVHQRPGETFRAACDRVRREAGWYQGVGGGS